MKSYMKSISNLTVWCFLLPASTTLLLASNRVVAQDQKSTIGANDNKTKSSQTTKQLERLLKQFPQADRNRDGRLTWIEINQFRNRNPGKIAKPTGVPREFAVDKGWDEADFPETSVSKKTPTDIRTIWSQASKGQAIPKHEVAKDGGLRLAGIGHSFMVPGYKTLPLISRAAGIEQVLYTHTGGGMTGSARYKWEQENGIFGFNGRPFPKILAAISNGQWDAMVFGPYFQDKPKYFECWIDFCRNYHPDMKFFISDAWPQLSQFGKNPESEDAFTVATLERLGRERNKLSSLVIEPLRNKYPGQVFVLPTSDAMVLAAKAQRQGELPGIEGVHRVIGGKTNSIWRDQLGHLGPKLEWLEGYVFYTTIYQKLPPAVFTSKLEGSSQNSISPELDAKFREIAWEAYRRHPFSGSTSDDQ